ncbi:MAG: hypothetical protein RR579_08880 [Eubacterium sp.]
MTFNDSELRGENQVLAKGYRFYGFEAACFLECEIPAKSEEFAENAFSEILENLEAQGVMVETITRFFVDA